MESRPVPQPVKAIAAAQRRTNRSIAAATRKSEHYVCRVFNGWQAPSPEFRAGVAAIFGLPEDALFRRDWFQAEAQ
jgi:hypothetical protein